MTWTRKQEAVSQSHANSPARNINSISNLYPNSNHCLNALLPPPSSDHECLLPGWLQELSDWLASSPVPLQAILPSQGLSQPMIFVYAVPTLRMLFLPLLTISSFWDFSLNVTASKSPPWSLYLKKISSHLLYLNSWFAYFIVLTTSLYLFINVFGFVCDSRTEALCVPFSLSPQYLEQGLTLGR